MTKEEELKAEIARLKGELEALKNDSRTCGCAAIRKKHYPTAKPDEYSLAIYDADFYSRTAARSQTGRWTPVKTSPDMKEIINTIPKIVADLQGLYEKLTNENIE